MAMIQEAHVGFGVMGNEGMQAVMSSDFVIGQFRSLFLFVILLIISILFIILLINSDDFIHFNVNDNCIIISLFLYLILL